MSGAKKKARPALEGTQRKGLIMGKTLFEDAKRENAFSLPPEALYIAGPGEPFYDQHSPLEIDEALCRNIKTYGVQTPIVVRKDERGRPVVVDGRRRTRHAIEANKRLVAEGSPPLTVKVVPHRGSDEQASDAVLFLNLMRRQIPPMVQAEQIRSFCGAGRTTEQAATVFGLTVSGIKQHLALAEASKAVQRAVEKGQLSVSAAVKAAKMDDEELDAFLTEHADKPVTVEKVARKMKAAKGAASAPSKREILAEMERLESGLTSDAEDLSTVGAIAALRWVLTGQRPDCLTLTPEDESSPATDTERHPDAASEPQASAPSCEQVAMESLREAPAAPSA